MLYGAETWMIFGVVKKRLWGYWNAVLKKNVENTRISTGDGRHKKGNIYCCLPYGKDKLKAEYEEEDTVYDCGKGVNAELEI